MAVAGRSLRVLSIYYHRMEQRYANAYSGTSVSLADRSVGGALYRSAMHCDRISSEMHQDEPI